MYDAVAVSLSSSLRAVGEYNFSFIIYIYIIQRSMFVFVVGLIINNVV